VVCRKFVQTPEKTPGVSHRLGHTTRSQRFGRDVPHQQHARRSAFEGDHRGHWQANPAGRSHHHRLVFQTSGSAVHLDHYPTGMKRGALVDRRQDGELAAMKRSVSKRKPGRLNVVSIDRGRPGLRVALHDAGSGQ